MPQPGRSERPTRSPWLIPRLDHPDATVAGVASGVARELGLPIRWVRAGFVILFLISGWGALVYGALWLVIRWGQAAELAPERASGSAERGRSIRERALALALIVAGLGIAGLTLDPLSPATGFPIGLIVLGLTLAWRTSAPDRPSTSARRRVLDLFGGVGLVLGGMALVLSRFDVGSTAFVAVSAVLGLIGTLVVAAPWLHGVLRDVDAERSARIRADERAEVAAHLHDSVLQTLALIQQVDDPQTVRTLARRQERELRNWLDPRRASRSSGSLRGRLDDLATETEELHGVAVEVVVVGDVLVDDAVEAIVRSTREATLNAARHSGSSRVDVFAEVSDDEIEVFVRDTGCGFDPGAVPADRRGVSESIRGRMQRAGGWAEVYSGIGSGTEVELRIRRADGGRNSQKSDEELHR